MGDKLVSFGHYKNKTFNEVFERDKEYCKLVLNNYANYRGDTKQFRDFLEEKFRTINQTSTKKILKKKKKPRENFPWSMFPNATKSLFMNTSKNEKEPELISGCSVTEFLKLFGDDHIRIFKEIIGNPEVGYQVIHEGSVVRKTSMKLGLFYGFFFRKCIHNLKKEVAMSHRCDIINIFPIKLNVDYDEYEYDLEIFKFITDDIVNDVRHYLETYFFNLDNVGKEIRHLLHLIASECCFEELMSLLNMDLLASDKDQYIRLLKKYMFFYALYVERQNKTTEMECIANNDEDKTKSSEESDEIEKSNDSADEPKTAVFYDRLLICAQSYRMFRFYTGDIYNILEDLYNVSILNGFEEEFKEEEVNEEYDESIVDKESLKHIFNYVTNFKNIENSIISPTMPIEDYIHIIDQDNNDDGDGDYKDVFDKQLDQLFGDDESDKLKRKNFIFSRMLGLAVDKCYLGGDTDLEVGDILIDFTYSCRSRNTIYDFYKLILYATMMGGKYKKLVTYNAYLGEETSINMIDNVEDIKNFIRTYRDPKALGEYISSYFGY